MIVERVAPGQYRMIRDGRAETIYVAGPAGRRWAYWRGRVYREEAFESETTRRGGRHAGLQHITAPMPATVLKVLATAGQRVARGDTLVIIEAMKMELPLRAAAEATVRRVRCREGELVAPEAVLVELE